MSNQLSIAIHESRILGSHEFDLDVVVSDNYGMSRIGIEPDNIPKTFEELFKVAYGSGDFIAVDAINNKMETESEIMFILSVGEKEFIEFDVYSKWITHDPV